MAGNKLGNFYDDKNDEFSEWSDGYEYGKQEMMTEEFLKKPGDGGLQSILEQRHEQRRAIFKTSMNIIKSSSSFVAVLLIIQSFVRIFYDKNFNIIDGYGFQIISVAVLGQAYGLIKIIARSIWDDASYIKNNLIKKGKK